MASEDQYYLEIPESVSLFTGLSRYLHVGSLDNADTRVEIDRFSGRTGQFWLDTALCGAKTVRRVGLIEVRRSRVCPRCREIIETIVAMERL